MQYNFLKNTVLEPNLWDYIPHIEIHRLLIANFWQSEISTINLLAYRKKPIVSLW